MYGADGLPLISDQSWFSITMTKTWSIRLVVTGPVVGTLGTLGTLGPLSRAAAGGEAGHASAMATPRRASIRSATRSATERARLDPMFPEL